MRLAGALAFLGLTAFGFSRLGFRLRTIAGFATVVLAGAWGWSQVPARNDRVWESDFARTCSARFEGESVHLRSMRSFRHRTDGNRTEAYRDATYDLDELLGVDLGFSYWGETEAIAHTFLSFAFVGGEQLAVSIEARRERGETYSPLKGLFRQYELFYVVGDERDVLRLRTNARKERTYLYPTTMPPETARLLLTHVLETNNELLKTPVYYSTLARNCTTALVGHFNAIATDPMPLNVALLLNGYSDEFAHGEGMLDTALPFPEAREAHLVSPLALTIPDGPDFSSELRRLLHEQTGAFPRRRQRARP